MTHTRLGCNRIQGDRPYRVRRGGRAERHSACEALESRRLLAAAPAGVALDTTFGDSGIANVPLAIRDGADVVLDASGKLLVAAHVDVPGKQRGALLRLNPDGSPDPTFNNGLPATLEPATEGSIIRWHAILPLADGGILVGGEQQLRRADGTFERSPILARYNADGSLDRGFGGAAGTGGVVLPPGGGFSGLIEDLALLPSGKVIAAGNVREQLGDFDYALWRFNAGGTPDATFGDGGFRKYSVADDDLLVSAIPLPDGTVVTQTVHGALAFNADGSVRGPVGNAQGQAVDVTADNKIVVASVVSDGAVMNPVYTTTVRRYLADGSPDLTFGANPDGSTTLAVGANGDYPISLAALPDGSVLVAAISADAGYAQHRTLTRLSPGGTPDPAFGVNGFMTDPITFGLAWVVPGAGGRLYTSGQVGADRWGIVGYRLDPGIVADPGGPYGPVDEGAPFQASAAGSSYDRGQIVKYEWDTDFNGFDFTPDGEGRTATLRAADDNPPSRLALRVTTDDGLQAIAPVTADVSARNAPPVVTQLVPDRAFAFGFGGVVYGAVEDPGGDAVTVRVDFGDGSAPVSAPVDHGFFSASHTYAARGTYTARFTATDDEGTSSTRELTLVAADVAGNVFHDVNDDGARFPGATGLDPGMPGVTVYADADGDGTLDDGEARTVTNDAGDYAFPVLGEGTYVIRVVPPAGWRVTNPGALAPVTVGPATGSRRDFGLSDRARITGAVFNDADADGDRDAGETALRGAAIRNVYLDLNNNGWHDADEPAATPGTPPGDQYVFANLLPGTYTVRYLPGLTTGNATENEAAQTFPNERGGQTGHVVTVAGGQVSAGNDFGSFFGNTTVMGMVYLDRNRDGDRDASDAGEVALADRVVYLDHDGDGVLDPDESRSRTPDPRIGNNSYFLPVVRGRTYTVRTVLPEGWTQSQPAGGNGTPYVITVAQNNTVALQNRDFGTHVVAPAVVGRHLFYYRSSFGNFQPVHPGNDSAIAPGKAALLPGQSPTFANVSSYTRGLNGVMVDLNDLIRVGSPNVLQFAVGDGTSGAPASWTPINPSRNVEIRRGAGVGGSDRLVAVFADNAIQNKWLRVTVLPGTDSGLSQPDVFYFGHLAGETGAGSVSGTEPFRVNALDVALFKRNLTTEPTGVGNPFDVNHDGRVNALDLAAVKANLTRSLAVFTPTPLPPLSAAMAPSRGTTAWLAGDENDWETLQ